MSRRLKLSLASLGGLVIAAALLYAFAVQAMQQVQPFYAEAIQKPPSQLETAGRRMESRVSALYSDAQKPGRWQTVFTADEVNGWLAVILKEKYIDLLPPEVYEPRVAFSDGKCQLGYRYKGSHIDAVISVEGDATMASEDVAAVRFRRAHAGLLPIPLSEVVEEVSDGALKLEIPVRWTEQDGDPVMLVSVANALSTNDELRRLEKIELRDGELRLAGKTEPRPKADANIAAAAGR
jgi:hypothetical protein